MSKNRDSASIIDIHHAAQKIINFAEGFSKEYLLADELRLSAILDRIMIMGEATKRLSLEFRQANSQISWREIAGIRNKLIHNYDNVKPDIVWIVVKQEIPELLKQIKPLLPKK